MSEENKVKIASDNGEKNRWAIGKFLYRQQGAKTSLNSKVVIGLSSSIMILGALYSITEEFFRPTITESKSPIPFNETVTTSNKIEVAQADVFKPKPVVTIKRNIAPKIYSGLEIVKRENAGIIPPGTYGKAKLITGATNGPVKAELIESLNFNGEEFAPEGTILVGSGTTTKTRLHISFSKMVFKDGVVQNIKAQACDNSDQIAGLKGERLSRYSMLLATGAGLNFLGGLSEGLQETNVQNGVPVKKSDLKNAALNGASKAAFEQSKDVLGDLQEAKTMIQVDNGTEFYLLFPGD